MLLDLDFFAFPWSITNWLCDISCCDRRFLFFFYFSVAHEYYVKWNRFFSFAPTYGEGGKTLNIQCEWNDKYLHGQYDDDNKCTPL